MWHTQDEGVVAQQHTVHSLQLVWSELLQPEGVAHHPPHGAAEVVVLPGQLLTLAVVPRLADELALGVDVVALVGVVQHRGVVDLLRLLVLGVEVLDELRAVRAAGHWSCAGLHAGSGGLGPGLHSAVSPVSTVARAGRGSYIIYRALSVV